MYVSLLGPDGVAQELVGILMVVIELQTDSALYVRYIINTTPA